MGQKESDVTEWQHEKTKSQLKQVSIMASSFHYVCLSVCLSLLPFLPLALLSPVIFLFSFILFFFFSFSLLYLLFLLMEKISLYIRETLDITYSLLHMFLWGGHIHSNLNTVMTSLMLLMICDDTVTTDV